jgi:sphinganine-1-phosphate aldolase
VKLPAEGKTRADVMALLERSMAGDLAWHEGRTFSLVYGAGEEHLRLLREAYALFMATNGLGAGRIFKSLAALEADLVGMSAELLGGVGCPGNVTSGGS